MAAICRHYAVSPAEYWDLTTEEEAALMARLNEEQQASRARGKG